MFYVDLNEKNKSFEKEIQSTKFGNQNLSATVAKRFVT